jgi:hypothetical protein
MAEAPTMMRTRATAFGSIGAAGLLAGALSLASVLGLSSAGCVATAQSPPPRGVVVSGPPPAPLTEDRPMAPRQGAVWVAGYWHWTGMQYAWIPGHWESGPPGATWSAPRYVSSDGSYFYEAGGWRGGGPQQGPQGAPAQPQSPPPQQIPRANAFH